MADEQDDYVDIGNEEHADKDAYIVQLQSKITELEETNKQQQFELQRAITASYGDGHDESDSVAKEEDITTLTQNELSEKLVRTQKFLNTIKNERDRLQYQLADMRVADHKLRRRLSEQFSSIPAENKDLASFIQYMIAEEQMNHLNELKQQKEQMELELKKMQYQVADEQLAKAKLEKAKEIKEKQLEYDIAEARLNEIKIAQKVVDVSGNEETSDPALLDPNELAKQLKLEIDRIKFRLAEEKMLALDLQKKNAALETELRLEREKISAMHSRFSQESMLQVNQLLLVHANSNKHHNNNNNSKQYGMSAPSSPVSTAFPPPPPYNLTKDGKNDDSKAPTQFSKQQSRQQWVDESGHTREVSMPGFHKQFTMNFEEEINALSGMTENEHRMDPNDPNITMELRKAYLEIEQLQKQLQQFTEQARDERALIWEKPRLTIQQISTFLRKLPDKHKEKMWERHCTGEYVKRDKVGSLLFSIVALCIKIHDRNVKTPQKGSLLKKLEPYTKLLESQIQAKDDPIGLTQEDFNDNLHEWLLLPLPIENLLSSTDREKLESELFETKKQLIEKDKEIFKERRKSKIFQESLAEIQKESERYDKEKEGKDGKPDNEDNEWKRRASEIINEKDQLNLEIIQRDEIIKEKDQRIQELEKEVVDLKLNKARDSEDDTELPDRQPNGHSYFSEQQALKAPRVAHTIAGSNTFEEEKIDYSVNDSNVTKSDIYIGWKKKAERMQELLSKEKQNNEELQTKLREYETMAEAYRSLQADNSAWKEKVQTLTDRVNEFDRTHSDTNRPVRRESIAALHSTIAKGVVFAEAEHEKIVSGYERQIHNLTSDLNYITNGFENYKAEMDQRMSDYEASVREQANQELINKLNEQKRKFEMELKQENGQRENLQSQLIQIKNSLQRVDELKEENDRLAQEIEQMRRNKQACMIAAAESMNQYREIIKRLNDRVRSMQS